MGQNWTRTSIPRSAELVLYRLLIDRWQRYLKADGDSTSAASAELLHPSNDRRSKGSAHQLEAIYGRPPIDDFPPRFLHDGRETAPVVVAVLFQVGERDQEERIERFERRRRIVRRRRSCPRPDLRGEILSVGSRKSLI